jgi:hypothetical protein
MHSGFSEQMKTTHNNWFRYSHPSVMAEEEKVELAMQRNGHNKMPSYRITKKKEMKETSYSILIISSKYASPISFFLPKIMDGCCIRPCN